MVMLNFFKPSVARVIDFYWFVFGALVFVPLEIYYDGLWFAYFQIIFLFVLVGGVNRVKAIVFMLWCTLILLSTLLNNFDGLQSIVNPALIGLLMIIGRPVDRVLKSILAGLYAMSVLYVYWMIQALRGLDITSLFMVLTSRDWGVGVIPGFGNGLAIIFSLLMMFAYRQEKYLLMFALFAGGVMTTSRIPFVVMSLITFFIIIKKSDIRSKSILFFVIFSLVVASVFSSFFPESSEITLLEERAGTTEDRFEVYDLAISKFMQHPLIGIGAEKLPMYEHAHNSYLQVLLKYGVLGFFVWIFLWYLSFFRGFKFVYNLDFIFVFILISASQIGLLNPNALLLIMLFKWIFLSEKINQFKGMSSV